MGALHHRADHHARTAVFARDHCHGGVADGEISGAAEDRREGLGVAASRADLHVQAIFLEDVRMHADIKIDVAEVVNRFAEPHGFEISGKRRPSHKRHRRSAERRAGSPLEESAAAQMFQGMADHRRTPCRTNRPSDGACRPRFSV
jgi:hypothetical protein